jgi:hypothetical protein
MGLFGGSNIFGATGAGKCVITDYTSSGCWYCCPGVQLIEIITIGAGGGGGNGINLSTTTSGDAVLGAAGGGGGGISQEIIRSCDVSTTGVVTVGIGGAKCTGGQADSGGNSVFCSGTYNTYACGGKGGYTGQDVPGIYEPFPQNILNGGVPCAGGYGNYSDGNDGGQAIVRFCVALGCTLNGTNGSNKTPATTRGGAGGGSAAYNGYSGSAGSASNANTVFGIDLTTIGAGGNGGSSEIGSGASSGSDGSNGFVRIIQYY